MSGAKVVLSWSSALVALALGACVPETGGGDGPKGPPTTGSPHDGAGDSPAYDSGSSVDTSTGTGTESDSGTVSTPDAMDTTDGGSVTGDALRCASARALPAGGGILIDQSTPTTGVPSTACRPSDAPQAFYSFDIPAGQRATFTVTPLGTWSSVLRVLESCSATSCLVDQMSEPGRPVTVTVDNYERTTLHKIVTVSSTGASVAGRFDISAHLATAPDATDGGGSGEDGGTDGGTCPYPLRGELGDTAMSVSGTLTTDQPAFTDSLCGSFVGRTAVYSMHLRQRRNVELRIRAGASNGLYIAVRRHCDPGNATLACSEWYDLGSSIIRQIFEPGDYDVVVYFASSTRNSSYTLDYLPMPALENTTCAAPMRVQPDTELTFIPTQWGGERDYPCMDTEVAPMPVLYYVVMVPAGQVLTTTVRPNAEAINPRFGLNILGSCTGADRCLTRHLSYQSIRTQSYANTGASSRDVIVALMGETRANLRFDLTPISPNRTCAAATAVTDGTVLSDQGAGRTDQAGLCFGSDPLFYSATILPGQTLTATASPARGTYWERTINLATRCGATSCLTNSGGTPAGNPATLTYTNTSASPLPVVFSVSRIGSPSGTGLFDLSVSLR